MSVKITPHGTTGNHFPTGRFVRAMVGLNTAVYRLLGGRGMKKMAILTTVGARSGLRRSLPVAVFAPGADTWWVVASKGGSATHPAWYLNLASNPDQVVLEIGNRSRHVRAESLHGAERDDAWRTIVGLAPNFGEYAKSTDREIPVVKLTAA